MPETLDVVILAGGGGRRLGGVSKADVLLGGKRLLDHLLDDLAAWNSPRVQLCHVVVVAPETVALPPGVSRTLEQPPGGGPAAGVAAGVALLDGEGLVAVLTCDAPHAVGALEPLLAGLGTDGAIASQEFDEPLLGVYRLAAVRRRVAAEGGGRDISARRLLGGLEVARLALPGPVRDVDTWEDLRRLERPTGPDRGEGPPV